MANTIPGGIYQGTDGSLHDANGKPVSAEAVEKFKALGVQVAPAAAPTGDYEKDPEKDPEKVKK